MRNTFNEQERQQNREMDVVSLTKVVFRHLKENLGSDPNKRDFFYSVVCLRWDLFPDREFNKSGSDHAKLLQAIALLETRGLVVRDSLYPVNFFTPEEKTIVYFTPIGMKSDIDDDTLLLVDKPEEIVGALEQSVENLDPIVREYYLESLRACQVGLHISSVICLGAASERAIHCLADAIQPLSKKYQENIAKQRTISDLTKYLSGALFNIFDDKTFAKELKELLDELAQLYRKNRNDTGHPDTVEQVRWLGEGQVGRLDLFGRYIATICEAIELLKNNGNVQI